MGKFHTIVFRVVLQFSVDFCAMVGAVLLCDISVDLASNFDLYKWLAFIHNTKQNQAVSLTARHCRHCCCESCRLTDIVDQ